jgi:hyaluronan synthase
MFLGTKATFGDDRSLTNFVLKTHRVIFHFGATCATYVPNKWSTFFRQQLRWKKSWTRETLVAARILWKKHPVAAISYYQSVVLTLLSPFIVFRAVVLNPLMGTGHPWMYIAGLCLVYFFLCVVYYYFTRSRYWFYGLFFAWLYVGVLCWMNYYAMVTVSKTHWGTR